MHNRQGETDAVLLLWVMELAPAFMRVGGLLKADYSLKVEGQEMVQHLNLAGRQEHLV